ncbi:hypothetical protein HKCCSP123_01275 [Rhodobacterales bacterium HKCCSP123]|nr:hypothetical protein [Rhodobacterales bacterium HKCCSP123]
MWFDSELALDYLSSLAALAILVWGHGLVRQRGPGRHLSPIGLGLGFGLVAVVQMNTGYQPVAGFLIDLRLVPLGLAGAYLGRRGLVACVVVALAGRYQIGGIGLRADMVAICLAGLAGLAWARATRAQQVRGGGLLVILSLATSVGFLPVLMLPMLLLAWFVIEALPVLMLWHMLSITSIALLLERALRAGAPEGAERGPVAGTDPSRHDRSRLLRQGAAGRTALATRADIAASRKARTRLRTGLR